MNCDCPACLLAAQEVHRIIRGIDRVLAEPRGDWFDEPVVPPPSKPRLRFGVDSAPEGTESAATDNGELARLRSYIHPAMRPIIGPLKAWDGFFK